MKCTQITLLCIVALCSVLTSRCQKSADISQTKQHFLKFNDSFFRDSIKLPFSRIEILDFRFDTTKLGYTISHRNDARLKVENGIQYGLADYLNKYYSRNLDPTSTRTLLIVLKKLWLQYGATNQILRSQKMDFGSPLNFVQKNSVCLVNLDVFAGHGKNYQALMRLDYNFLADPNQEQNDLKLLLSPFDS